MPKDSADLVETLAAGLAHHQVGRFAAAETLYREVLAHAPAEPTALYFYGLLALATGRPAKAEGLLSEAVALRPDHAEARFAHANALYRQGDRHGAIAGFRRMLADWPDHFGAHVNLSNCLREAGEGEAALAEAEAACRLVPDSAAAHTTRAAALLRLGWAEEAIEAYQAALVADPRHCEAHAGLAASLLHAARPAVALAAAEAALLLAPDFAEAHFLRGMALAGLDAPPAAIAALERAIALEPSHAKAHLNLGNLLTDCGRIEDAERLCRRAIALDPGLVEAHTSLGFLLTQQGRLEEAITACDRALALDPEFVQAQWNQGIALLLAGDYARGWEKYEARKGYDRFARLYPDPDGEVWRGQSLAGRRILVVAEQGLGDTIQFARYLPLLVARGASVILACDQPLVPLLSGQLGLVEVIGRGSPWPHHDYWVNQMSLPHRFATGLEDIPSPGRYLVADPERVRRWQDMLPAGPRIGLVWAGNPQHSNDARRSMPAKSFTSLLEIPGASFVSLQVGPRAKEASSLPGLLDFSGQLTDFCETAGLIEALDLVISVDTSSAHCAAALGKRTWIMLPHTPDWRWLTGREDSPWYAAVRLFRQPAPGAWDAVVDAIRASLLQWFGRGN